MHTKLSIISFFQKLIIFLLLDFQRIQEEVFKLGILWSIAWVGVNKRFIWFFKNYAPQGTKVFCSNSFKIKGSVYRNRFITNSNHQFFQDPRRSKIWKHFHPYFPIISFCTGIYSLFRSVSKIPDDKNIWNTSSFISCTCWHQALFTYFKSAFRNERTNEQKQEDRP